jgi:hypothetical protein
MLLHGNHAMKHPFRYLLISTSLLIGSSADALAHCGRSHNVVAPHHGLSLGYGAPSINRYSHHYRPRHFGSRFSFGHGYVQPFNQFYGGHFNNRPRYYRPRRGITPYNFRYNY